MVSLRTRDGRTIVDMRVAESNGKRAFVETRRGFASPPATPSTVDLFKREMQMFFEGQARVSQLLADAARDAQQRIEEASSEVKEGNAARDNGRQSRRN